MNQLKDHAAGYPCPFLVEHACAVHPVRPVSCRQCNVFTKPCADGEDPFYTRRDDVLVPLPACTDRAFASLRGFYRLEKEPYVEKVVRFIPSQKEPAGARLEETCGSHGLVRRGSTARSHHPRPALSP